MNARRARFEFVTRVGDATLSDDLQRLLPGALGEERQERARTKEAAAAAARRAQPKPPAAAKNVETKQCPGCGAYIPAGYATCGRAECNAAA